MPKRVHPTRAPSVAELRADFWRANPAKVVYVLSQRPSFTTDGGTDSTEYALFVWEKGWRGQTALEVISWR